MKLKCEMSLRSLKSLILDLLILITLALPSGCRKPDPYSAAVNLKGIVLISSDSLHAPQNIALVKSYLVVGDATIHAIQAYRADDGAYAKTLGRFGKGPGEIIMPSCLNPSTEQPGIIWVFDLQVMRLTEFDVDKEKHLRTIDLTSGLPYNPVLMGDSLILSCGLLYVGGRFGIYDSTGKFIRNVGIIPEGSAANVPVQLHLQAYQSTLRVNPRKSLLVVGTRYGDRLDILKADGEILRTVHGPVSANPFYTVVSAGGTPVMATDEKKTLYGYIDIAVTEKYIFALFSGRTRNDFPGRANFGNHVHVFDWDGKIIRAYNLDSDVLSIAVDGDGRYLYGIQHEPRIAVIRFEL